MRQFLSLRQILSLEEAEKAIGFADSYSRLGQVFDMVWHMSVDDWWTLLGRHWSGCDNIAEYRLLIARELRAASRARLNLMMTDDERKAHAALPQMLTVYRGCYAENKNGLSWTLNRGIAERIVTLNRYRRPAPPLLLTGRVNKADCVLKTDREEEEIISAVVRRTGTQNIHPV
jgi:hypothetical protein